MRREARGTSQWLHEQPKTDHELRGIRRFLLAEGHRGRHLRMEWKQKKMIGEVMGSSKEGNNRPSISGTSCSTYISRYWVNMILRFASERGHAKCTWGVSTWLSPCKWCLQWYVLHQQTIQRNEVQSRVRSPESKDQGSSSRVQGRETRLEEIDPGSRVQSPVQVLYHELYFVHNLRLPHQGLSH